MWLSCAQCGQCCPKNYTEAYFEEDHSRYSSHPAVLLAQASLSDNHADLCASTNYCERQTKHDNAVQASSQACCKVLLRYDEIVRSAARCFSELASCWDWLLWFVRFR